MAGSRGGAVAYALVLALSVAFGVLLDPDAGGGAPTTEASAVFAALAKRANAPAPGLSFALGYNVCLDAIARAADVLALPEAGVPGADAALLRSVPDVQAAFTHFFAGGAAAERATTPAVMAQLVAAAEAAPGLRKSLGGNAALMARRLAAVAPGAAVVLGGHVGPDAAALLPPSVALAAPAAPTDEVHLILEYSRGEVLGGVPAPRANRFIVTADAANTRVGALLATIAAADAARADSLTIAGLHMLEPLPADARRAALAEVAAALRGRNGSYSVHVELASCADAGYVRELADALFPLAHSLGFNEQEAAFVYTALGGPGGAVTAAAVAASRPAPAAVAALLRWLLEAYPSSLTRLHFHSLAFHVVAYRKAAVGVAWRGNAGAVAAGAAAATTEACGVPADGVTPAHVSLLADAVFTADDPRAGGTGAPAGATHSLSSATPVASWLWGSAVGPVAFRLAPVAVCARPASTVGLGDAVSATGLAADVLPAPRQQWRWWA